MPSTLAPRAPSGSWVVASGTGADAAASRAASGAPGELAREIGAAIEKAPLYYTELAEKFSGWDFPAVARALGELHAAQKLWQDPRGRLCLRGSAFAAKPAKD